MNTSYLTLEEILVIHEDQIERYGGTSGLRQLSLLESALFRPQSTFDGKDLYESLFNKAAALIYSLIQNHPFVDGNKRTGIVAGFVFLGMNRLTVEIVEEEIIDAAINIATKKWDVEKVSNWLKHNSTKAA